MVAYLKRRVSCLFDMAKYIGQRPRNDASIRISFCSTRNRKCLSGTSLPICKYRPVIALKALFNHVLHDVAEDCFLLCDHVEDAIEFELKIIFLDLIVAESVPLKVELYFAFLR
jgi:hypothetical protein